MKIIYEFIGWNSKDNHDKVWTVIRLGKEDDYNAKFLAAYGRRGKKLQTKIYDRGDYEMGKLIRTKQTPRKGYVSVDENKLAEVYPDFEKDLKKTAFWAMMSN